MKRFHQLLSGLTIIAVIAALVLQVAPGALAAPQASGLTISQGTPATPAGNGAGKNLWQHVPGTQAPAHANAQPAIKPKRFESYTLNRRRHGTRCSPPPLTRTARPRARTRSCCRCRTPSASLKISRSRSRRSWSPGWPRSTRRSRPTADAASMIPRPRSVSTSPRLVSTPRFGRPREHGTSTRITISMIASTSATTGGI